MDRSLFVWDLAGRTPGERSCPACLGPLQNVRSSKYSDFMFHSRTDAAPQSLRLTPEAKGAAYGFAACLSNRILRTSKHSSIRPSQVGQLPSPGCFSLALPEIVVCDICQTGVILFPNRSEIKSSKVEDNS